MKLAEFSVKNPVFANLLMVSIIVLGGLSFINLPRELMSEIPMNWVFIITPYPGVPPEEVERLISIPLENEIQDVAGIESISSQSVEGSSFISVKFEQMSDQEFRARFQDLRAELDKVDDLPEEALGTTVQAFTSSDMVPVIAVHIHGAVAEKRLLELSSRLRDRLIDVSGVSKVQRSGSRDRELWVEADPLKLRGYQLSTERIRLAIAAQGVNVPAGRLTMGRKEVLVRTLGEFDSAREVGQVIVHSFGKGQHIRVSDVARVREGFAEEQTRSRHEGQPVHSLTITKRSQASSIAITDEVKRIGREFEQRYGSQIRVNFTQDTSEQIQDVLSKLSRNAWAGFAIVVLVLMMVLGLRNAILAALGIPLSFLACFLFLDQTGGSFNSNSLFGLVLVLGIIVDDAIIIVENCYRHLQLGKSWRQAAIDGTQEVMGPVLSATGTTIAVFLPLMLLPGIVGKFLRIIPITVSLALLASVVEAFLILPAHFADWPGRVVQAVRPRNWMDDLRDRYGRALRFVIRRRYVFSFLLLPFLLVGAVAIIPLVGVDMFAGEEIATFQVRIKMPPGTSLEATSKTLEEFERQASQLDRSEVRSVNATAGLVITDKDWIFSSDVAQVWLDLTPSYERERSADQIMNELRTKIAGIAGPTAIELAKLNTGPPMGKAVEVKVKGKNFDQLRQVVAEIKSELRATPGVQDVDDDFRPGKREVRFVVDQDRAALYGLSVVQVGLAIRSAIEGVVADSMYDEDEEIDIVVKVDPRRLSRPEDILLLPLSLPIPGADSVPLGNVASFRLAPSWAEIRRYKQQRAITVSANVDKSINTSVAVNRVLLEKFADVSRRHPGISLDFSGEFKEFQESFTGLIQLFLFGLLLVYVILGTQFRSYIQPLVILLTVPFAFVGAGAGLLISGTPFSLITLFGIVALAGVAVNDAIVMISFVNDRKRDGMDPIEAVVEAGRLRLRPIILTSVTTIAGLVPMAVGLGGMSLTWAPLANTIVWGLGVGTMLAIFLVPAAYVILVEDIAARFKRSTVSEQVPSNS